MITYWEDAYPNLSVPLQIFLTISVPIAIFERLFGKVKLILTYFGSSIGQGRPSTLAQ